MNCDRDQHAGLRQPTAQFEIAATKPSSSWFGGIRTSMMATSG